MTKESINFFCDILEKGSLSEEAKIIVRNILMAKSMELFSNQNWYQEQEGEMPIRTEYHEIHDYRIASLSLRDFRAFPLVEDKPFGINIKGENGKPCCLFLIGCNGTGKSSIFSAIETFYTDSSSLANERKVDRGRFLSYAFKGTEEFNIKDHVEVELAETVKEILPGEYATPTSFCSLYDVQLLEQSTNGMTEYVLQQLGFNEVLAFYHLLGEKHSDMEEEIRLLGTSGKTIPIPSADWNLIIQEYISAAIEHNGIYLEEEKKYTEEEEIRNYSNSDKWMQEHWLFSKEWKKIRDMSSFKRQSLDFAGIQLSLLLDEENVAMGEDEEQVKRIAGLYKLFFSYYEDPDTELKPYKVLEHLFEKFAEAKAQEKRFYTLEQAQEQKEILTRRMAAVRSVRDAIRNKQVSIVRGFMNDFEIFIKKVLSDFSEENEDFEMVILNNGECDVGITVRQKDGSSFPATPKEYFNSFRFVLYCVALKLAMALNEMVKKKIVVPIVIDDVFDVSDFENSVKLEDFICQIFRSYQKHVWEQGIEIPLQLIILSHDEMMKSAFERGIEMFNIEEKAWKNEYRCGRLLPYQYARRISDRNDGKKQNLSEKYYNLYMSL